MAELIQQSLSVLIQTKIVENLIALSIEQTLLDPNVAFTTYKDKLLPLDKDSELFPLINVWIQSLSPITGNSTGLTFEQEVANFALDCYVIGKTGEALPSDEEGTARLKYLVEQAKYSILSLLNIDFGLPAGSISKRHWPSVQYFQPDLSLTENTLPAARIQFSVEYCFKPQDWKLEDLKKLNVDTNLWAALFNY